MKRRGKQKNLSSLARRNTARAQKKKAYVNELRRLAEMTNVSCEGARFGVTVQGGFKRERAAREEEYITGVFRGSGHGYGFVERDGGRDIFIPEAKTGGAIDGDVVEARYHSFTNRFSEEKTEGTVLRIIEEGKNTFKVNKQGVVEVLCIIGHSSPENWFTVLLNLKDRAHFLKPGIKRMIFKKSSVLLKCEYYFIVPDG